MFALRNVKKTSKETWIQTFEFLIHNNEILKEV